MFCSYCGQAAVANASSCAKCGKPLRSAQSSNPALIAFVVLLAITTVAASGAAFYYARDSYQARRAMGMIGASDGPQLPATLGNLPPPPPPPPPDSPAEKVVSPCDAGVVGGVEGGVPGGVPGGVLGGAIGEPPSPSAASPKRIRVGGSVAQANLISQTPLVYPSLARNAKVQGPVVLLAQIDKAGKVANLRVLSGHPMLMQSAMDAVRQWRYKPYLLNGEPVEVETAVTVNFKLAQ